MSSSEKSSNVGRGQLCNENIFKIVTNGVSSIDDREENCWAGNKAHSSPKSTIRVDHCPATVCSGIRACGGEIFNYFTEVDNTNRKRCFDPVSTVRVIENG